MPGLAPGIHVLLHCATKTWMAGTSQDEPGHDAEGHQLAFPRGQMSFFGFIVAQTRLGRRWWSGLPSLFCQVVGAGMSFTGLLSLFRATRRGPERWRAVMSSAPGSAKPCSICACDHAENPKTNAGSN